MVRLRDTLLRPNRRMLSSREAAAYCGAPSIERWRAACPVRPVRLYRGRDGDLFDVADLDRWIEDRKASSPDAEEWLKRLTERPK